jgi:lipid-A-disaccharide synthase
MIKTINSTQKKKICIVAGEASGDSIGANLIRSLRKLESDSIFFGVGGVNMLGEGFRSLFAMNTLSVMGFSEVMPRLPKIMASMRRLIKHIVEQKPDVIITIDSPGFNFRLVKKLRKILGKSVPIIHYVAPTIWAYKPERASLVKELYDHLFLILPFEKTLFEEKGVPCTYVGHPVLERYNVPLVKRSELSSLGIGESRRIITIMPGSRKQEVKRHLEIFIKATNRLREEFNDLVFFIPTLPHLEGVISAEVRKDWYIISAQRQVHQRVLPHTHAALVKSGTASVELSYLQVPMVVSYKMSKISELIVRRLVKGRLQYASIANILLDKPAVPELLFDECTSKNVYNNLKAILSGEEREKQLQDLALVKEMLYEGVGDAVPSQVAADIIVKQFL